MDNSNNRKMDNYLRLMIKRGIGRRNIIDYYAISDSKYEELKKSIESLPKDFMPEYQK